MSNKKELNEKELEEVAGGGQTDTSKICEGGVGAHIPAVDAPNYIGRMVYVLDDHNPINYCWGKLERSWMASDGCDDVRKHSVYVEHNNYWGSLCDEDGYIFRNKGSRTFNSEDVTLYLKEN